MSSNDADGPPTRPGPPPQAYAPQAAYGTEQTHPSQAYPPPRSYPPPQAYPSPPGYPLPHAPDQATVGYAPPPVWVPPVPVYPYAHWGRRVGAYVIDFAPSYVAMIPFLVGYVLLYVRIIQVTAGGPAASTAGRFGELVQPALVWMIIGLVLMLIAVGWQWYNRWLVAGRTGQSLGKRVLKTKLVAEINGQPIGAVNAFLRDLLHILDGAAYIGYLWPLWDAKRQTFADMIMKTVVVDHPPRDGFARTPTTAGSYPNGTTA